MDGTRRCWSCKKVVEMTDMRYDSSGKDLICADCLAKENRGQSTVSEMITAAKAEDEVKSNEVNSLSNEEVKALSYQCGSCRLGFSIPKGAVANNCPYCGKGNVRIAFRDSAQSLIEQSARENFDD